MNSFDSTTIKSSQNISKLLDEGCNCTAIDKITGEFCGESETLKIIDEFQKLYETRIKNVDREFESEYDQVCMKLEISKEWVKNLREQNIMLVQVVEDLEQAAYNRVKLLEQKLKHSSLLVSGNMTTSMHTEKTIDTLANRVSALEKDEEYMRQKIEFLQSDIRGLLELIRRAVQENDWSLADIKFFEILPSDIPVPTNCTCDQGDIDQKQMQTLKLQIKHLQENETRMITYQKQLEDKLTDLNTKLQTKEDTIKKYVSQFQNFSNSLRKRGKFPDQIAAGSFATNDSGNLHEISGLQNVCFNARTCEEDTQSRNPINEQNQIISYLSKVKSLMEEEREDLSKLKIELEKTIEKLGCEKDEECRATSNGNGLDNVKRKLAESIKHVNDICSKKMKSIEMVNSLSRVDVDQQFKLMDVFKACAVEAQVTMDDIKDEMNVIFSSFKCRHQTYIDLNKEVVNVQNELIKSREKIAEAINRLQLREEERMRHNDRIISGKNKLKDIKNEINRGQSRLAVYLNNLQANENMSSYTEMCICNDLLCSVIEEIEQTSFSLQIFQVQGGCITTDLGKLKNQFCEVDSSIKKLQEKIDEALSEHDITELTLVQKEEKLQKLEAEVDEIHGKIQNVLESFFSSKEHVLNAILQIKESVYRLRKEHDELAYKLSQKSPHFECDKKTCTWKGRVTDLQDQVKILQHEAMCNEEANNFLRNNIHSVEEELQVAQVKADSYRRSHSIDNIEMKKKIIELENTLKFQKEIECTLRRQLHDSEVELKKSKESLNSPSEHRMDEALLRCGYYQFRYDPMNVPQLFVTLQNTIRSTKAGLQELKVELKKLVCEQSSDLCSSTRSLVDLLDKLQTHESELDTCSQEVEELKNALYSKDKLIENMDEIIKIQKDSIVMTQAELKELHQKFQKKIDNQDEIISEYEKEKKELLRQNELQTQTIGHLQSAVVEAKKCIDQMGHRTVSDMSEQWSTSSSSAYSQNTVHDV